ncbi:monooxygenase [Nannocystis sp. SCPEA4]|uniref:monooxygenase n=1 Tax=Nannocystis sp. SCPEA4 TaxID=2996787 RepID=UPI00226D50E9|nr:monooxygenase [Nannocystis sp. SCPEA4]MCY1059479.1 monooxygenase [Nannocystis sp. SCPEA4]
MQRLPIAIVAGHVALRCVGGCAGASSEAPSETSTHASSDTSSSALFEASSEASSSSSSGALAAAPTYYRDVAPLLASMCTECHRSGGIAPFGLSTYEEAAPFAALVARSAVERTMPPYNLDNSGACNTYVGAPWLADGDIATLTAWAQAGAPAGDPTHETLESPPAWQLDRVDLTLEMPVPYAPIEPIVDDYRCFILEPDLDEDAFVTAFEVRLGRPDVVHHLTLYALDSAKDEQDAAALDAADEGPGYTCFGEAQVPSRWLVGTGPHDRGGPLPAGTGLRIGAGRKAVLQLHYNWHNGSAPDRTAVDLKLEPMVPREAAIQGVSKTHFELPPGQPAVLVQATETMDADYTVWGVWPHMHNLGRELRVTAKHAGGESCVAQVNRYQFHWQLFAFYEQPLHVREGDTLHLTCTYDTTGRDTPTKWGFGTDDEMCIGFFYVTRDG